LVQLRVLPKPQNPLCFSIELIRKMNENQRTDNLLTPTGKEPPIIS